jgi:hypothetical protein
MNNQDKIKLIEEIVQPYFNFEMNDFYGDRGGLPYPNIEDLTIFYFKRNGKDKKLYFQSKKEEPFILEKVKKLNIGKVELITFPGMGVYICVELNGKN